MQAVRFVRKHSVRLQLTVESSRYSVSAYIIPPEFTFRLPYTKLFLFFFLIQVWIYYKLVVILLNSVKKTRFPRKIGDIFRTKKNAQVD